MFNLIVKDKIKYKDFQVNFDILDSIKIYLYKENKMT